MELVGYSFKSCKFMKKRVANHKEEVIKLLKKQKIRNLKDLEDYKLSICHPYSAGIDIGSREISNELFCNPLNISYDVN